MTINVDEIVLRPEDIAECALGGLTPQEAINMSIQDSRDYWVTRLRNGTILAIWGYKDLAIATGTIQVWMLSTTAVDHYPTAFGRLTRRTFESLMANRFMAIVHVDPRYTKAIRWLEWLGFHAEAQVGAFIQMTYIKGRA